MNESQQASDADKYSLIAMNFLLGFSRMFVARIVSNECIIGLCRMEIEKRTSSTSTLKDTAFSGMLNVDPSQTDSFEYITNMTHLVYATTLLDAFISDSTHFLYLLHPNSVGTKQILPFRMVVQAVSKAEVIDGVVKKKVKEISYLSFFDRVQILENTFGLNVALASEEISALNHYTGIRNVLVHSQSVYQMRLDIECKIETFLSTCPRHPTPVSTEDLRRAERVYIAVAGEIYRAINKQILKSSSNPEVKKTLRAFVSQIMATYNYNIPEYIDDPEAVTKVKKDFEEKDQLSPLARKGRKLAFLRFEKSLKKSKHAEYR